MSFLIHLRVRFHRQEQQNYCGAACAQMVLQQTGANHLVQKNLFTDNNSHGGADRDHNWATPPDGLKWTMNKRKPRSFKNKFELVSKTTEDAISREIVWCIHKYGMAPIALVRHWAHWVVITGFETTAGPLKRNDRSYQIKVFWMNDPLSNLYHHADYDYWQNEFMTGVLEGHWRKKYLAVCDPDGRKTEQSGKSKKHQVSQDRKELIPLNPQLQNTGTNQGPTGQPESEEIPVNPKEPPSKNQDTGRKTATAKKRGRSSNAHGEKIIDKKRAVQAAVKALDDYGFKKYDFLTTILEGIKPGNPILVQRLDKLNDFYYLVPFFGKTKNIHSLISIDGKFATYQESAFIERPGKTISFDPLSHKQILRLLGKGVRLRQEKKLLRIHPQAMCIYPILVWRPCKESMSPYMPFHMVTVGSHQLYIRVDGKIFSELTTNQPGL